MSQDAHVVPSLAVAASVGRQQRVEYVDCTQRKDNFGLFVVPREPFICLNLVCGH